MSYCRTNGDDSDVYLIGTWEDLECFGADWRLEAEKPCHEKGMVDTWEFDRAIGKTVRTGEQHETHLSFITKSRKEMIEHLLTHRRIGHKVPARAIARLQQEIKEQGDAYGNG